MITVYNKSGEIIESYSFNNPGPDGLYNTQDDIYDSYEIHFYDKNGNEIEYIAGNSPGNDGIWLTDDDGFSALHAYEYENNLLTKEIQYSDTDVISSYCIFNYDQDSRIDTEWCYKGPGPDKNWFTEDDELLTETIYRYDEYGNIARKTVGHDKYDNVSYWYSYSYNSDNKITDSIEYNKAGYDNQWFTDDDVIKSREHYEYNKKGQITLSIISNSPGTDGIWFNSDDNINSYTVRELYKINRNYILVITGPITGLDRTDYGLLLMIFHGIKHIFFIIQSKMLRKIRKYILLHTEPEMMVYGLLQMMKN